MKKLEYLTNIVSIIIGCCMALINLAEMFLYVRNDIIIFYTAGVLLIFLGMFGWENLVSNGGLRR